MIASRYDAFIRHREYWRHGRLIGETDLIALRADGRVDVYEVKLTPRRNAYKQLLGMARIIAEEYDIANMYVFTASTESIQRVIPERPLVSRQELLQKKHYHEKRPSVEPYDIPTHNSSAGRNTYKQEAHARNP